MLTTLSAGVATLPTQVLQAYGGATFTSTDGSGGPTDTGGSGSTNPPGSRKLIARGVVSGSVRVQTLERGGSAALIM